jgi:peptidoglycan/xylan/chitin deacetylase (PgdA/CDA1 family)
MLTGAKLAIPLLAMLAATGCSTLTSNVAADSAAVPSEAPSATAAPSPSQVDPSRAAPSAVEPSPSESPTDSSSDSPFDPEREVTPSPSITTDTKTKVIYLTFDDGPWFTTTEQILDILAEYDATATFFVQGEMAWALPDILKKIHKAGHAIGNHTYRHANLTTLSDEGIRETFRATTDEVGRNRMGACMRPPYGATNDRVRAVSKQEGYKQVLWDTTADDWNQPSPLTMVEYLKAGTKNKANILLHDGGGERANTVAALQLMMPIWVKRGFTFEAVPACARPLAEPLD